MSLLSQDELDSIMKGLGLSGFKEEVKRKSKAGRPAVKVDNPFMSQCREVRDLALMPAWLDDVITGATRTQGNTNISPHLIFSVLCNMPFITTTEIKSYLNRKRLALQGREVSNDSYCSALRRAVVHTIKSIEYHLSRGKTFSDRGYNLPYTTTEINEDLLQISPTELIDMSTGEILPITTGEIQS